MTAPPVPDSPHSRARRRSYRIVMTGWGAALVANAALAASYLLYNWPVWATLWTGTLAGIAGGALLVNWIDHKIGTVTDRIIDVQDDTIRKYAETFDKIRAELAAARIRAAETQPVLRPIQPPRFGA